MNEQNNSLATWQNMLRAEAMQSASSGRWSIAFAVIGWVHLVAFSICQAIVDPKLQSDPRHAGLWIADVLVVIATFQAFAGRRWYRETAAAGLIVRIWGTFLILSFS